MVIVAKFQFIENVSRAAAWIAVRLVPSAAASRRRIGINYKKMSPVSFKLLIKEKFESLIHCFIVSKYFY